MDMGETLTTYKLRFQQNDECFETIRQWTWKMYVR